MYVCWNATECRGAPIPTDAQAHLALGVDFAALKELCAKHKRITSSLPGVSTARDNNRVGKRNKWWWIAAAGLHGAAADQPDSGWSADNQLHFCASVERLDLEAAEGRRVTRAAAVEAPTPLRTVHAATPARRPSRRTPSTQLFQHKAVQASALTRLHKLGTASIEVAGGGKGQIATLLLTCRGADADASVPEGVFFGTGTAYSAARATWELQGDSAVKIYAEPNPDRTTLNLTCEAGGACTTQLATSVTAAAAMGVLASCHLCPGDAGASCIVRVGTSTAESAFNTCTASLLHSGVFCSLAARRTATFEAQMTGGFGMKGGTLAPSVRARSTLRCYLPQAAE